MKTEVELRDTGRQLTVLTSDQLEYISRTEFVPPGLRGNLPAILACVATGRAIGISDMTALRSIHVIDGKATFSAELMVLLVRRDGHSISGEVSDGKAVVTGKRVDNGDEMSATWTVEMAERAGLLGKSNWKKYPEAMLWARAVSQLCRMLFADCFAGTTYTTEELGEDGWSDDGALVESEVGESSFDSTSALADFTARAKEAGLTRDQLTAAKDSLFPGRATKSLDEDELGRLWAKLVAGLAVETAGVAE